MDPEARYWHPNLIIKAADNNFTFNTDKRLVDDSDIFHPGFVRRVIYRDGSGNEFPMELIPYKHPAGAGDLTLGSIAYSADGVATYTATIQNQLILFTGSLSGAAAVCGTVAGMLFADYFTHWDDNASKLELGRATKIQAGDIMWVVRNGIVNLKASGAVSAGSPIVTAADGKLAASSAIAVGTITALKDSLIQNIERASTFGAMVGKCITLASGANVQFKCELMLPRDYRQV
tara:strand:- start:749 stop:1447 length:699 start_codon:yes stop_codon:yes gene_type:complete